MATTKYPTSTSARNPAPTGWSNDRRIRNLGTIDVCLSDVTPLAVDDGEILPAGSAIVWTAGTPLWTISAGAGQISVSDTTGALFDAGAIASQMIAQGLAGDIGTAVTGGVPVNNAGIAAELLAGGVPAANVTTRQTITDNALAVGAVSAHNIDCGIATSFQVFARCTPATVAGTNYTLHDVRVTWYADAARTQMIDTRYYYLHQQADAGNGALILRGPVLSRYLTITHENNDGGTYAMTYSTDVVLTTSHLGPLIWRSQAALTDTTTKMIYNGSLSDGQYALISGQVPAGAVSLAFPDHPVGPARLWLMNVAALTGDLRVSWRTSDIGGLNGICLLLRLPSGSAASSTLGPIDFELPNMPGRLYVDNGAAATADIRCSLTWPPPA